MNYARDWDSIYRDRVFRGFGPVMTKNGRVIRFTHLTALLEDGDKYIEITVKDTEDEAYRRLDEFLGVQLGVDPEHLKLNERIA